MSETSIFSLLPTPPESIKNYDSSNFDQEPQNEPKSESPQEGPKKTLEEIQKEKLEQKMKRAAEKEERLEQKMKRAAEKKEIQKEKLEQKMKRAAEKEEIQREKLEQKMKREAEREEMEKERLEQKMKQAAEKEALQKEELKQKMKRAAEKEAHRKLIEAEAQEKRRMAALKSMEYLLGLSESYTNFFRDKVLTKQKTKTVLTEGNIYQPTLDDMKLAKADVKTHRNPKVAVKNNIMKRLKYFVGKLHPYQEEGVAWLKVLFEHSINGILADEMGLGKTIQVIALLCHLYELGVSGPYLIVVPLSTLPNWCSEFKRFAPKIPVVVFYGSEKERREQYHLLKKKYPLDDRMVAPVVLVSYQGPTYETRFLQTFNFQYIIVDEGHKIKNPNTKLAIVLRSFTTINKMLLTGTPLQNNLSELWALLNFILPHIFKDMETFTALIAVEDIQDRNILKQEESNNLVSKIHKVLAPFMLRRQKKDVLIDVVPKKELIVYCPLSKVQKELYHYVLTKNFNKLQGKDDEEDSFDLDMPRPKRRCAEKVRSYIFHYSGEHFEDSDDDMDPEEKAMEEFLEREREATGLEIDRATAQFMTRITMNNTMMMFRKIVDHPYLVHMPLDPSKEKKEILINEDLIATSGKMMVLDVMLKKLKKQGHKVLIFSTLTMMLDIIEDYMIYRNHKYRRLDGSYGLDERAVNISDFNNDPDILAFLISTRAGGLGLNLTGADTVIFFDRDWNPQADIQAQDRCHRIGQTRPVMVYTLVTKNTIDEKVINTGTVKRLLEKIIIKDGKFKTLNQEDKGKVGNLLNELKDMLEQGETASTNYMFCNDIELDKLLDRSELYKQMQAQAKENQEKDKEN